MPHKCRLDIIQQVSMALAAACAVSPRVPVPPAAFRGLGQLSSLLATSSKLLLAAFGAVMQAWPANDGCSCTAPDPWM